MSARTREGTGKKVRKASREDVLQVQVRSFWASITGVCKKLGITLQELQTTIGEDDFTIVYRMVVRDTTFYDRVATFKLPMLADDQQKKQKVRDEIVELVQQAISEVMGPNAQAGPAAEGADAEQRES